MLTLSSIDLIILGHLLHGEQSAYDMVKEFETWNITNWIKISNASIYKKIIKLCKDGYLNSRTVREGEMPEKTVYSINEKGHKYFHELMDKYSTNVSSIYFDFSAFIVNLENLDTDEKHALLKKFNNELRLKNEFLNGMHKEQHNHLKDVNENALDLIDLYQDLFKLLDSWSSKLLQKY